LTNFSCRLVASGEKSLRLRPATTSAPFDQSAAVIAQGSKAALSFNDRREHRPMAEEKTLQAHAS